ncbi:unnamed protein product [Lymnaea stagnalis]|uniref:Uncharacterized protein n=1 Tax=Lymnaea stagnalis TaxID=6523 RepID=A0AAV2I041_LYMST
MKVEDGLCSALDNQRILRVSCTSRLPFICQKDAQFARTLEDYRDNMDTVTYIQNMTSFHPQTLPCPLGLTAFDDVIVWFKDGRPILDTTDDDRNSFGLKNGQLPNSLAIDLSILEKVGELDSRYFKPAMLQGEYWCEIWRKEPFHRVTSHRIFLKFTDVITLRGVITTEPASHEDAAMFNRMGMRVGLPAAMELRLTSMNKNITHFLRGVYPIVRDVITFLKSTNPVTGRSEFVTYICTATGDLTPSMRGNLADLYLSTFYEALVQNEDYIRTEWRLTLPLTKAISVSMTDLCPSTTLVDKVTGHSATFLSTVANNQVMSVEYCNGRFSGTAYCKGNLMTGAYWDAWRVSQSCQPGNQTPPTNVQLNPGDGRHPSGPSDQHVTTLPTVTEPETAMLEPTEAPVVAGNVEHIRVSLTHILAQSENLTHSDIEAVAQLAHSAAGVNSPPREICQMLMDTVNKVLDSPTEELMRAETDSNAPSRLLADMERFGSHVDMGVDPHFRYVTPNIAMDMWDLNMDNDVVIGLGATEASSWSVPLTEPRILTIKNRTWSELNLPGFDVAIELPESLVKNTIKYSEKTLRLTMFLYRKTAIFQPTNQAGQFSDGVINSAIISASLGDHKIRGLEDKVRLVFKPFKEAKDREKDTKCVFWDMSSRDAPKWSTEGCTYNGTLNGRDVCLCDHLTNFAILLDFYGDAKPISPENEASLNVLSLIGISLSIFGLAMTIITFLAFKKLRQGRAQQTLFNMAIALLCFQTTFLVGVKQTTVKPICLTVSVLLHYFILVSFAWMLIEAVLQYLTFVKVLGTYISRYTLKTVLPAWGFPLVPVIAVLATDYNLYHGRANYCWMDLHAFYYSLALPVGIIIVFNIVMFFVIIASLVTRPKGLRSNQTGKKTRETNLKAAVTIFILLGLTWMFGYLAVEDARVAFQYAFTILSSLQGFLIFILMVVRRKQVRDQWSAACCAKGRGHQHHQKQLSPTSSSSTTSNNSRTLPSFINHTYNGDSLVLKPGLRRENSVSI